MKQIGIFIAGFFAGIVFLFVVLYVMSFGAIRSQEEVTTINRSLYDEVPKHFVEIKGKNGKVNIHTGMIKDSVKILVGNPDEVNMRTILNSNHETWGYKIKNKYRLSKELQPADLRIEFVDGRVTGVNQD